MAFVGFFSSKKKTKLKFYSIALILFLFTSLPLTSYFLSYPLVKLSKGFSNNNYSDAVAILVLTGGIKKSISGLWMPSNETTERLLIAQSISSEYSLPIMISGGRTSDSKNSEAIISKNYFKLYNSSIEQKSLNTYQSALNLKEFCKEKEGPILMITGPYHSLRSYLTFISHKCNVRTYQYNSDFSYDMFIPSLKGFSNFNSFLYESFALLYYVGTNKIKIF